MINFTTNFLMILLNLVVEIRCQLIMSLVEIFSYDEDDAA